MEGLNVGLDVSPRTFDGCLVSEEVGEVSERNAMKPQEDRAAHLERAADGLEKRFR